MYQLLPKEFVMNFTILLYVGLLLTAYLLGSISNALWIGKKFYNIDVREHGSKNAGATNVLRVLGWKASLPVFALDVLKGVLAVMLIKFTCMEQETEGYVGFQIILGMMAVAGHIFPLFSGFKGGKGVATIAGVVLAIHPNAFLITLVIFILCLLVTHYVSLSSIIAALFYPLIVIVLFGEWLNEQETITLKIFSIVAMFIIFFTHRKNIKRLLKGEESKIVIRKRPSVEIPPKKS